MVADQLAANLDADQLPEVGALRAHFTVFLRSESLHCPH